MAEEYSGIPVDILRSIMNIRNQIDMPSEIHNNLLRVITDGENLPDNSPFVVGADITSTIKVSLIIEIINNHQRSDTMRLRVHDGDHGFITSTNDVHDRYRNRNIRDICYAPSTDTLYLNLYSQ